ncbi:leukotriene A-4 hydrolase-like isoform X2 [Tigriopus californicus]|nr:leukotriene A-4 hydrolase-like isoform X2 [Tigriopus californicus]
MSVINPKNPMDPSSLARPDQVVVKDVFLQLEADFKGQVLKGSATLTLEKVDSKATQVVLDSSDLSIGQVTSGDEELKFTVGEKQGFLGSAVVIELPKSTNPVLKVVVQYVTSPSASALQWLPPAQTAGKVHPYMFSQCQAIHCRSMVPLQDTPAIKMPYSAEIIAPAELTVLMSAVPQGEPELLANGDKKKYKFVQKIPIQSYLIAIAIGKLESRRIGPRSHVWSEKEFVEQAAFEFSQTEEMLQTAEDLNGPYVWGIYDILVLPPSFPYGGMENPCLTFATPTLLAGDKSLANVIAHEIAHSWTGNLVTNKNFEHFWLNEGFTVFAERKILGRMSGEPMRHFDALGGWKELQYTIDVMGQDNPLTNLVVDLSTVDPDDAFSKVPYEKGSTFLWYLEDLVGGALKFEPFLKSYYEHFKFQAIDSNQFRTYFLDYFKDENEKTNQIQWDAWFNTPGMPIYRPSFDESLAKVCQELKDKWIQWNESTPSPFKADDLKSFLAAQKEEFLALLMLEDPLSVKKLETMEAAYHLNDVNNCEIRYLWIRLGLKGKWTNAIPRAVQMVTEQGRMKYLRPLYRDLYAWEETRTTALKTFEANKPNMMKVAIQGLEHDLKLAK